MAVAFFQIIHFMHQYSVKKTHEFMLFLPKQDAILRSACVFWRMTFGNFANIGEIAPPVNDTCMLM